MNIPLEVVSATRDANQAVTLIHLVLNDNSQAAIYLNDGSPRTQLHDLLDAWLADGNEIAEAES